MTTHLSVRLAWHDRGWDGHVCDKPHENSYCMALEHIRKDRQDDEERRYAGLPLMEVQGYQPPCTRDPGAWSAVPHRITHNDPLEFRRLGSVEEIVPPYSVCPTPYRWMREENFRQVCEDHQLTIRDADKPKEKGWVMEADRQKALLNAFWSRLEPSRSLLFYYTKQGNPVDEGVPRLLVGIGRVKTIGPEVFFGRTEKYSEDYLVWSRSITQDHPGQGVRLPYQEYLRLGLSTDDIACRIPETAMIDFSYVGEHVSDDVALSVIERLIPCVERVQADGHVPGDWGRQIQWLNDVLAEVWTGRGPYPGLGSVLQYLDFARGTSYQRAVLAPMAKRGEDPWAYVLAQLEGRREPEVGPYRDGLRAAAARWKKQPTRQALLACLTRFELSPHQVRQIANPDVRVVRGIEADDAALVANPYLLCELDRGWSDWDDRKEEHAREWLDVPAVSLETIDHGMRPEGDAARFHVDEIIPHDDRRRVRAVGVEVLKRAAEQGDTVLTFDEHLARVRAKFPARRACQPDREVILAEQAFHDAMLELREDQATRFVSLRALSELERETGVVLARWAKKTRAGASHDWPAALERHFGAPRDDRDRAAFDEKRRALQTLLTRRLSVLMGGAGTGKTSVLKVFLDELEQIEGKEPMLLLAPTGKARVRLSTRTGRNAMTAHQFLLRQGWLRKDLSLSPRSGTEAAKFTTVVIDECSMLTVDFFATILKAVDGNVLKRLILVGDPYQLPPIGPGRPFVDVIAWLRVHQPETLAELHTCMRVDANTGTEPSRGLRLAEGYRADHTDAADDELLGAIARGEQRGDLDVVFWKDHDEMLRVLEQKLKAYCGVAGRDYRTMNTSLGFDTKEWQRSESWQILCPTRGQAYGVDALNRMIQDAYRGGMIKKSRRGGKGGQKPFGPQEIVYTDKVIQTVNNRRGCWPKDAGLGYVANGEIGVVTRTSSWDDSDTLDVSFATQPEVSYRYKRGEVESNLELAYALTVHKAQGSDFDTVFLILPQEAPTRSRELLYTAFTRFKKRLVLLIERDLHPLIALRAPDASDTRKRNTWMFQPSLRPDPKYPTPHPDALIHRTQDGRAVRSKSEVIVANVLKSLGISWEYEKPLPAKDDPRDFRLPDFTVFYEGDQWFWEHLGMLSVPAYREAWERKKLWYERQGLLDQLIISKDDDHGGIDASEIERIAREKVLEE